MTRKIGINLLWSVLLMTIALPAGYPQTSSTARANEETSVRVVVKDAATGDPVYQAHLTLQFQIPQKFKLPKWIAYSAKTDKKGEYTFRRVNKGPIRLLVTAEGHQSYGKQSEIDKDDQVIEVKLRKPQPQI